MNKPANKERQSGGSRGPGYILSFKGRVKNWIPAFAGMTAFLFISIARADIATGLIGHWAFDEGTGLTANDTSPTDTPHNGILYNAPAWVTGYDGSLKSALNFDGYSYIDMGGVTFTDNLTAMTASASGLRRWPSTALPYITRCLQ